MQRSASGRAAPRTPRRRRRPGLAAALAAAVCLPGVLAAPLLGQENERALFVSVLDEDGAPVPDLAPGEFVVEEGYRFTVVEANERTISKLRVEPEFAAGDGEPH